MELYYYIAWICMIHLTLFSIILFFKKANRKANRALAWFLAIYAYMHFTHLLLLKQIVVQYHFFNEIGFSFLFLQGPLYLQYISLMTGIKHNWKKYFIFHALPFIPVIIYVGSFFFLTTEEIKNIYSYTKTKEPLSSVIILSILICQLGFYLVWSMKLINRQAKKDSQESPLPEIDFKWLKLLTLSQLVITFIVGPALIGLSSSDISAIYIYVPLTTMFIYSLIFYKAINFPNTESAKKFIQGHVREQISRDMHDDFGSGLSKIVIMSEVLKSQMNDTKKVNQVEKISKTASDMVDNMGQIIWAMSPDNDNMESFLGYLRKFTLDFFEDCNITCQIHFPNEFIDIQLSQVVRRNLLLVIKENYHNILKHAKASEMIIKVQMPKNALKISITDNGHGFNMNDNKNTGNGLNNMRKRMAEINGHYEFYSETGRGTQTHLNLDI